MARTFPRTLLEADLKSEAERKVFDALRDQLSDEWTVFHSASVIYRDHAQGARDDEGDFILCHPDRAIVCLEVKGGGLQCRHGEWSRVGRDGTAERIRDPFSQALDHRYALKRKIEEQPGWRDRQLLLVHALAFPDLNKQSFVLAPDAPPEIILDRHDLGAIDKAIERVLAYHEGSRDRREPAGADGVAMLEQLLAPTFEIKVPMATVFDEEDAALIELTDQQATVINHFWRDRRMVVTGCAGSGKTMIAVERGRQLAQAGRSVLFVCFNRALCRHLADSPKVDGLDFFTFHGLCTRMAHRAKIQLPTFDGDPPPEYWSSTLPNALMEAVEDLGGQYDDILVDEAQDLASEWLIALTYALRDVDAGSIWLFMDANQRVYDKTLEVPDEYRPFDLTVNCRNTQAIHREVTKLYRGETVPDVKGPSGRQPQLLLTDDEPGSIEDVLERLCGPEDVRPEDVVVLSGHGRENSALYSVGAGSWSFVDKRGRSGKRVFFSSIRGFKGLESPVVILCELDNLSEQTRDNLLYVGLSRARNHAVIVAPA